MSRPLPSDNNRPEAGSVVGIRMEDVEGPDPIATVDAALRITAVNQAMADLAGSTPAALIGLGVDHLASWLGGKITAPIGEVSKGRVATRVQSSRLLAGAVQWFDIWIVPRRADEVACIARDVSDMKRTEERLRESAGRDSLTGLMNHAAFHDEVSRALSAGRDDAPAVALVLFDLDYLKLINDVHGHQTGDQALREVAGALRATMRQFDHVARLGGDEFGALFVGTEQQDVIRVAERAVARICATVLHGVGRLSTSAGIAFVSSTREPGDLFDRPTQRSTTPRRAGAAWCRSPR